MVMSWQNNIILGFLIILDKKAIEEAIQIFYQEVFEDPLIGYLFRSSNKEQLIAAQLQFTLSQLGYGVQYMGRPIRKVHRPLQLRKAQFLRRQKILTEVLKSNCHLDQGLKQKWLNQENSMMAMIVHESCR